MFLACSKSLIQAHFVLIKFSWFWILVGAWNQNFPFLLDHNNFPKCTAKRKGQKYVRHKRQYLAEIIWKNNSKKEFRVHPFCLTEFTVLKENCIHVIPGQIVQHESKARITLHSISILLHPLFLHVPGTVGAGTPEQRASIGWCHRQRRWWFTCWTLPWYLRSDLQTLPRHWPQLRQQACSHRLPSSQWWFEVDRDNQ